MTDSDSLPRPAFAGARLLVLDEVSDAKQLGSPPALYRETLRTLYAPEAGRYAYSIADSTAPSWGEPRKSLHWLSGPLSKFDTAAAQPGP
jgi:hypothetical protein